MDSTETNEVQIDVSPDAVIDVIQGKRLELLHGLGENEDDVKVAMRLMDSLSSTAIGTKRIAAEEHRAEGDKELSAAIFAGLNQLTENPFLGTSTGVHRVHPRKDPDLKPIELTTDETSTELASITFNPVDIET